MVPEEWPIAAEAADPPVESARPRGASRLASVRRDFFLDPAERLSEQERALMTAMLHDLVGTIAGEIAALVRNGCAVPEGVELAARLTAAGLLDRPQMVAQLLQRADEHRIASAFAGRAGPRRLPLLPMLVGDSDAVIAAAAMAVVVARGRRRDPFGQPRIELSDLTREDAAAVMHAVAAALGSAGDAPDAALSNAAEAVLAGHNLSESLVSAVAALVEALGKAGRASDSLVESAAEEGEVAILAHLLARQAAIDPAIAWDFLVNDGEGRIAILARMAGISRQAAARLLAELGAMTGAAAVEQEIARFDELSDEEVQTALAWWRLPEPFRQARSAIGASHG